MGFTDYASHASYLQKFAELYELRVFVSVALQRLVEVDEGGQPGGSRQWHVCVCVCVCACLGRTGVILVVGEAGRDKRLRLANFQRELLG